MYAVTRGPPLARRPPTDHIHRPTPRRRRRAKGNIPIVNVYEHPCARHMHHVYHTPPPVVSYAPKDYTHREISHTLRTRSTPRDLGRDLARDRRCPRRGPRVHVIGTVCAYRMIYHMRGVDRDRACDRDVSIRRYVDRRNDRSTYRSIDRRIDRSQPRLATGRRTFAGARRARAIPRTLRIRNVCRHPSLRASRQDRRRVHRQGHQRQVHDGLEAARQQVRIRRARRSTTRARERDWVWITPGVDGAITDRDRVLTVDASRARAR